MVAAVRCAPPENKPTPLERDTCAPWIAARDRAGAAVGARRGRLGAFGWAAALKSLARRRVRRPATAPRSSATAPRSCCGSHGRSRCSAATTRRSTTPSPAASPREMLDAVFGRAHERARLTDISAHASPRHHRPRPRPSRHHRRDHRQPRRPRPEHRGLHDDAAARPLRDDADHRGRGRRRGRSRRPGAARPPTARSRSRCARCRPSRPRAPRVRRTC